MRHSRSCSFPSVYMFSIFVLILIMQVLLIDKERKAGHACITLHITFMQGFFVKKIGSGTN